MVGLRDFEKLIRPLRTRVVLMLSRAVVSLVDEGTRLRTVQLKGFSGETLDDVEHFEPYGFTSKPFEGAEAILASLGGNRSHGVAIVVADRRYRLLGLEDGEAALYDDQGQRVVLRRDGIEVSGKALTVEVEGDALVTALGKARVEALEAELVAGSVSVESTGEARITAAGAVSLEAAGAVDVKAAGNVSLAGAEVSIAGGVLTLTGLLLINGVPYLAHTHTLVETGTDISGPVGV